jgi:hypothetical protein
MHALIPNVNNNKVILDNLFHHRLNFKWFPTDNFTTVLEARNRIFYGELVRITPDFGRQADRNDDQFWLSLRPLDEESVVGHMMLDRAYVQWSGSKLELRLGRQRINWGINTVWNTNDLFNAYNYLDFDHRERPGSDAARLTWYTGATSSIEVASKITTDEDDLVAAGLWKFNDKGYDFQVLAGFSEGDIVFGGGWAGNIKKAGFKGELTYFRTPNDIIEPVVITATMSLDYVFKGNVYVMAGMLYNSFDQQLASFSGSVEVSAKNPFPQEFAEFVNVSVPVTPLINSSLTFISSSEINVIFPTIAVSVTKDLDLSAVAQLFTADFDAIDGQAYFLRLQYNY